MDRVFQNKNADIPQSNISTIQSNSMLRGHFPDYVARQRQPIIYFASKFHAPPIAKT
uniref:Uncharacterized protein n=1 Tax=Romanomermis culicivorax TaxID=13658 RepID=A0A915KAV1_ROMCU